MMPTHISRGRCDGVSGMLLRLLVIVAFWSLAGPVGRLHAEKTMEEYEAKAKFIANFVQFVQWPGATTKMVGVLGDDPFGEKLENAFGGRWTVKRSRRAEDLKNCQIVFVAKSERGALASLADAHVLTVGEGAGFAKQGGIIGFVFEGESVRFEINLGVAKRAQLVINAKLLKLASLVIN